MIIILTTAKRGTIKQQQKIRLEFHTCSALLPKKSLYKKNNTSVESESGFRNDIIFNRIHDYSMHDHFNRPNMHFAYRTLETIVHKCNRVSFMQTLFSVSRILIAHFKPHGTKNRRTKFIPFTCNV